MAYAQAYAAYKTTSIQTATKEQLLIMLYDGLIRFIHSSKSAIAARDIAQAHTNLIKSQEIVGELKNTLDMKYEISHALSALYDYFMRKLVDANVRKSQEPLDEILPRIAELRDAWEQAAKLVRQENGAQGMQA